MLGKLIKYEFKATRKMLLIYGLLLVLAIIMAVMMRFSFSSGGRLFDEDIVQKANLSGLVRFFETLITAAYAFMNAFVFGAVLFCVINRFRVNLLGNQGYLMHTLPVKTEYHILTKNLVSLIWTILGIIAVLLSYAIIGAILMDGKTWKELIQYLFSDSVWQDVFANEKFWIAFAEIAILGVVSISELYFRIYASMAIGYSANKHRFLASVGAYIVMGIAKSMPQSILIPYLVDAMSGWWWFLVFEIVYSVVWGAAYYFVTAWFLNKHLNLQ